MDRMAALPAPLDNIPAVPKLSLVPSAPSISASSSTDEPQPVRPRFRRLVVFTGKIA
jgi:hypothetical protein